MKISNFLEVIFIATYSQEKGIQMTTFPLAGIFRTLVYENLKSVPLPFSPFSESHSGILTRMAESF